MRNILVIKLRYVGDVLLATPVLRALREQFPDARLTMAVNRGTEDVLKWNPDVNEILVVERSGWSEQMRFLRALRRRAFDCVLDLTDGDRSAILAWASGVPFRIGMNEEHRWRGLLYTTVVKVKPGVAHRVEQDLQILHGLGIEPKVTTPVLKTSPGDDREAARLLQDIGVGGEGGSSSSPLLIMLQPGARYWFKAWPAEQFAELADRLAAWCRARVLIGGGPDERELAESIRGRASSAPSVVAGRTTLLQYAALLNRCALFVGNDNGPMHMAAALGVPVVALFGPSDPAVWGPRGGRAEILYKGLDCRRCFHPTCDRGEQSCMRQIRVDEVFAAAQRCLTVRLSPDGMQEACSGRP
jgi:predicted lipopolysaccharide heptosyltransferase III